MVLTGLGGPAPMSLYKGRRKVFAETTGIRNAYKIPVCLRYAMLMLGAMLCTALCCGKLVSSNVWRWHVQVLGFDGHGEQDFCITLLYIGEIHCVQVRVHAFAGTTVAFSRAAHFHNISTYSQCACDRTKHRGIPLNGFADLHAFSQGFSFAKIRSQPATIKYISPPKIIQTVNGNSDERACN